MWNVCLVDELRYEKWEKKLYNTEIDNAVFILVSVSIIKLIFGEVM